MNNQTSVTSVKVACIRPAFDNLKEWINDSSNIYIGRKGIVFIDNKRFPDKDSIWANPFKTNRDGTLEEVIAKYDKYIRAKLSNGEISREELEKLRGKNLGCWCRNKPATYNSNKEEWICHGDVLLQLLDELA